jgi:catechol 2,3-dioxygenase-like lactoylglutathione lyase family enzyme
MAIIPILKCSRIEQSVHFYTKILDFKIVITDENLIDPCYVTLKRNGYTLHLSSHSGDGSFGTAVVIQEKNLEDVFKAFKARGLNNTLKISSPVHQGVILQTWGTLEFYVDDPDGNTIRFTEEKVI